MARERTLTSRPRCLWMPINEFPNITSLGDEVDLNASPNKAYIHELLDQPFGTSSSMIGGDYSYDFPPFPPPHFHEEPAPHMDNSHRLADKEEEEEAPAATVDPSPSMRPRRKKLCSEVWQFSDHAYQLAANGTQIHWAWCKLCRKKFNANSTACTTVLKNHHMRCQAEHDRLVAAVTGAGSASMPKNYHMRCT